MLVQGGLELECAYEYYYSWMAHLEELDQHMW